MTVSAEKPGSRVLVIEADDLLRERLRAHFTDEGYQVVAVGAGQEGLQQAQTHNPSIILLALGLPDIPGQQVFHQIHRQARTAHIPVMVLAGRDEASAHKALLEEGAYDVIEKPIDMDILALRVRNALRRAEREGLTESRTGLPTGRVLEEQLAALAGQTGWARLDLTLTEFGTFRDQYGFVTANEALRFAGGLILQTVNEFGTPQDFVGHRANTETFVIITTQACGPQVRDQLVQRLTGELRSFYNFVEREQGYVVVDDGAGGKTQRPLMSVQVTLVQATPDPGAPAPDASAASSPADDQSSPSGSDSSTSAFEW